VVINGGSLSCDWKKEFNGVAIMNKGNANITINGGHVGSYASAIEMWGGQLTMSGGTLESSYDGENTIVGEDGDADGHVFGAALAIYPASGKSVSATINGGTLQGVSSIYETNAGDVTLSVTNGKFEGSVYSETCTGFISNGQFKYQPQGGYLIEGKKCVKNGDYYIIVDVTEDGEASLPSWGKDELGNN
jgi:hypothetical protein